MIRKLLICPWFGPLPSWFPSYQEHRTKLTQWGYDFLITHDLDEFNLRVQEKLGIQSSIVPGVGKVWDYRCCFGELFADELAGYDYWGHTDFDCVYGNIERFMPDRTLQTLDIWSNHVDYICGPWTVYRNCPTINSLFREYPLWAERLRDPLPLGWVEFKDGFTGIVDQAHTDGRITRRYTMYQTRSFDDMRHLRTEGDMLIDGNQEIMMAHFRRTKVWPL